MEHQPLTESSSQGGESLPGDADTPCFSAVQGAASEMRNSGTVAANAPPDRE